MSFTRYHIGLVHLKLLRSSSPAAPCILYHGSVRPVTAAAFFLMIIHNNIQNINNNPLNYIQEKTKEQKTISRQVFFYLYLLRAGNLTEEIEQKNEMRRKRGGGEGGGGG